MVQLLTEKRLHPRSLRDAGGPFLSREALSPPDDLFELDSVLDGGALYGDGELCRFVRARHQGIGAELSYSEGDGFIQGFGLHVCSVGHALFIVKRDRAALDGHERIIALFSLFIRFFPDGRWLPAALIVVFNFVLFAGEVRSEHPNRVPIHLRGVIAWRESITLAKAGLTPEGDVAAIGHDGVDVRLRDVSDPGCGGSSGSGRRGAVLGAVRGCYAAASINGSSISVARGFRVAIRTGYVICMLANRSVRSNYLNGHPGFVFRDGGDG